MTETPPEPDGAPVAPARPQGGLGTKLAADVAETGYGVDPEGNGVSYPGLRLAGLIAALVLLGFVNPWMLVVILALVVMITLHELGHFLTAKRAGMKVTEFFLGFGPKIWSTRRGETEYGIKLIPAGAYVKIIGMTNLEEVDPADEGRTYRQKSFGQRVSVAVAGSTMHFILAVVLIFVALAVIGQPGGSMLTKSEDRPATISEVYAGSGADEAGIRPGDTIVTIDGEPTPTFGDLGDVVADRKGDPDPFPVEFERDGELATAPVQFRRYDYTVDGQQGSGCGLGIKVDTPADERVNPLVALGRAPKEFVEVLGLSTGALGRFFTPGGVSDFASQVGNAQDDKAQAEKDRADAEAERETAADDPCAAGAASGPAAPSENRLLSIFGLVRIGSDVGEANPSALIGLFAMINIFIGVFNLVPLLPFDGGHVVIAAWEKFQEVRLKRKRYFMDVAKLLPLTYGVVAVLGLIFFSSLYLDIANPLVP